MKHLKKSLAFLLVMMMLALTACSGSSDTTGESSSTGGEDSGEEGVVTLRMSWWGSQSRHDQTKEIIDLFEKENPNIKIEPSFTGFDGYFDKMAAEAAGNNLPDIMQQNFGEYLNQYADKGLLEDLTPFVENGTINMDGVSETVLESGTQDGQLLGIPTGTNALVAFYNQDMFDEAGVSAPADDWTWDDFAKISEDIAAATGKYGARLMEPKNLFEYYLRTQGYKMFNEDGTGLGYDDDQLLVNYFNMNKELVEKKALPAYDVIQQIKGVEDELIARGDAAIDFRWSNQATAVTATIPDANIQMQVLPGPGNDQGMYLKPAMLWSIPKSSKHKEEAAKFIDFFINNIEVYNISGSDRGVPLKQEIRDELAANLSETDKKVFDYISKVTEKSSPIDSNFPASASEVLDRLATFDEQVIYGQLSPEEGAKQFRQEAEQILGN
ncbi:ABC transporter substrate-binding protein [Bacillus sp. PS06]|uniref:ABC transporter substrate-binding protein n=1 Tax=Bacillus sp. PS06 TaxID=2764176 RepID=UPI00177E8DA9|nr:ABC transporter substrate-binding protein [Bacillus sp. PS06]MBD8070609.1 carbohydrate ABC transporter substrate-binding protein [Bacillus sp. PS06]